MSVRGPRQSSCTPVCRARARTAITHACYRSIVLKSGIGEPCSLSCLFFPPCLPLSSPHPRPQFLLRVHRTPQLVVMCFFSQASSLHTPFYLRFCSNAHSRDPPVPKLVPCTCASSHRSPAIECNGRLHPSSASASEKLISREMKQKKNIPRSRVHAHA